MLRLRYCSRYYRYDAGVLDTVTVLYVYRRSRGIEIPTVTVLYNRYPAPELATVQVPMYISTYICM